MKNFDVYLRRAIRTEPVDWTPHYVNYEMLKERLSGFAKRRKELRNLLNGSNAQLSIQDMALVMGEDAQGDYFKYPQGMENKTVDPHEALWRLSQMERADFCELLETEISKSATFYSTQLVGLAKLVEGMQEKEMSCEEIGNEILEVYCFVAVNLITLRQILIRYDGYCRTYSGAPLNEWYLQNRQWEGDSFQHEDYIEALFHLDALNNVEEGFVEKAPTIDSDYNLDDFSSQYQRFRELLEKTFLSIERAAGGHIVFRDRFISTLRHYFLVGSIGNGLSMEPKILRMKGRHLKKEMKDIAKWRETHRAPEEDDSMKMDPQNVFPLILNLVSCFLFMMTNYIIEPSSAYYANALGSSDALSGLMIGLSPWFALVSAVLYSMWTNKCYKHPILFAGILMTIGNFMYGYAYSYQSMEMCLVGRAIAGLGAPRVINRRYVADATPFGLRTAASAAFALATALGAALGPGMAIVLDLFDFEFWVPFGKNATFNGMTGPGFFMSLCWALYTVCILVTFREPKRSGLDELRRREAESSSKSLEEAKSVDTFDDEDSVLGSSSVTFEASSVEEMSASSPLYCFKHITTAVVLCMSLLFMKRIALESIVGSTSIITKNRYEWTIKNVGTLHLVNGIIVIPVSVLAGWLSQFYEDRFLASCLLVITCLGMLLLVDPTDLVNHDNEGYNEGSWLAVGPIRYIAGSLIAFSGIEACESYVASLMSKVVPSALAVGTFNSGLLATLVGTSGRATGDIFITLMALISIRNLLNLLILPSLFLMVASIILIHRHYDIIAV